MNQRFRNLLKWMPVSWKAALEYHFDRSLGSEFGGPFNGQEFRQQIFKDLDCQMGFKGIVETGTFRGVTTAFMAGNSDAPIFSVETEPRFFHYAKWNLRKHRDVKVANDDSRAFVESLIGDETVPKNRVFFYFDAHWNEDLPLFEEVKLIGDNWRDVVIMIDDFEVPDDPDYKFDDYGEGKRLCLEYLGRELLSHWAVYFPAGRGADDTGIKRGCVVLATKNLRLEMDQIASLRPYETTLPASTVA
jgi:hypothetical protein